ncbi:hypothetical protein GCM10022254_20230 [Actinomadura meridiana]|uniref:Uncharacterized protein n=1 Tax=Actinomadura meridiana TaxID=559626 RepID=A0ABP8BWZ6_9ACTN
MIVPPQLGMGHESSGTATGCLGAGTLGAGPLAGGLPQMVQ